MNKWQSIVLGIMVVAICIVIFTAPKYVLVPGQTTVVGDITTNSVPFRVYSDNPNYDSLKGPYGSNVEWDTIAYICIPILLIGCFFIIILKKANDDEVLEKIKRHLMGETLRTKNWHLYLALVILIMVVGFFIMLKYYPATFYHLTGLPDPNYEPSPEMQKFLREINK